MGRLIGGMLVVLFIFLVAIQPINGQEPVDIRVAVYFSTIHEYAAEMAQALNCSWTTHGTVYRIIPTIIDQADVMGTGDTPLDTHHFDVLAIPGSGRPYIDAMHPLWKGQVISFVANGGGYLGVCGGANLASMGFQEPRSPNNLLEPGLLRIVNVYVNDQQLEEWQYLWKANWEDGMPPITVSFPRTDNPMFAEWTGQKRSVRYGGGPGMYLANANDTLLGPVVPLAIYVDEPMDVAPLHYWEWRSGWHIKANVTTDIKGQYAAVASTYGAGRVALFSPHPEKPTWFGGHIEEFPVRPNLGPLTWFIYNWTDGVLSEGSYNWWMLQRAVAWLADAPLPISNLSYLDMTRDSGLFLCSRQLMPLDFRFPIEQMLHQDNHRISSSPARVPLGGC